MRCRSRAGIVRPAWNGRHRQRGSLGRAVMAASRRSAVLGRGTSDPAVAREKGQAGVCPSPAASKTRSSPPTSGWWNRCTPAAGRRTSCCDQMVRNSALVCESSSMSSVGPGSCGSRPASERRMRAVSCATAGQSFEEAAGAVVEEHVADVVRWSGSGPSKISVDRGRDCPRHLCAYGWGEYHHRRVPAAYGDRRADFKALSRWQGRDAGHRVGAESSRPDAAQSRLCGAACLPCTPGGDYTRGAAPCG